MKMKRIASPWVVVCVPESYGYPAVYYAYNRDTLEQVRCNDREEARTVVGELRNVGH